MKDRCEKVYPLGFECSKKKGHSGPHAPVKLKHPCHAEGCAVEVPPNMLMCIRHWRMVPRALQREVWREYVPGQEVRKDPTGAYLDVMRRAISVVRSKEGIW